VKKLVVTLAGDSGDGVQLLGNAFTDNIALSNYDLNTLPDFPAEIRAPAGTIHGVSGFQIQYGYEEIHTAGQYSDVLIAFNAAALKKYIKILKPTGTLILDPSGFDAKNCKLANFDLSSLEEISQRKIEIEFSKMTIESLQGEAIPEKEKDKNKNIFALGLMAFAIDSSMDRTQKLLSTKFKNEKLSQMLKVLAQGYYYAETIEFSIEKLERGDFVHTGIFKNITGNKAIALAIISAPKVFGKNVFFGGYPITPASDILHEIARYKFKEIIVRQAEDEIAAAAMALGAGFGGSIAITASSGPGIDLKQEVIGLAHMAEIPLLVINVQRAGPSTGMPTKVEQSDLNLTIYGRHGDCPVPVVAIKSPASAYQTTLKAMEIMIKYQTPIFLLSDAQIANGSQLWKVPQVAPNQVIENSNAEPYGRNDNSVRPWTTLGEEGINYIAGGLEKDYQTGTISYDGDNHEKMTKTRAQKIANIQKDIDTCVLEENSAENGSVVISWGSTYGSVRDAIQLLNADGIKIAHIHLEWLFPFPKNFLELINSYKNAIVVELNNGQLANHLAHYYDKPIHSVNKVKGLPFYENELKDEILKWLKS